MELNGQKLRWTFVFAFTSLVACAIFYVFLAGLMVYMFPWYCAIVSGSITFLGVGVALIEWISKYI